MPATQSLFAKSYSFSEVEIRDLFNKISPNQNLQFLCVLSLIGEWYNWFGCLRTGSEDTNVKCKSHWTSSQLFTRGVKENLIGSSEPWVKQQIDQKLLEGALQLRICQANQGWVVKNENMFHSLFIICYLLSKNPTHTVLTGLFTNKGTIEQLMSKRGIGVDNDGLPLIQIHFAKLHWDRLWEGPVELDGKNPPPVTSNLIPMRRQNYPSLGTQL
jgi:hypothetical protein